MRCRPLADAVEELTSQTAQMRAQGGPRLRRHARAIRDAVAHLRAAEALLRPLPEPQPDEEPTPAPAKPRTRSGGKKNARTEDPPANP